MHNTEYHLRNLYKVYFSCGQNQHGWDEVMDKIQSMAAVYELMDELITKDLVERAIELRQKSKGLRRFCIDMMVYVFLIRSQDDARHMDISGNKRISSEIDNESKDPRVFIKTDALKLVHALSWEDLRFSGDFMSTLCEKHQLYGATEDESVGRPTDPRCFSYNPDMASF
jgi:hypothetical protein